LTGIEGTRTTPHFLSRNSIEWKNRDKDDQISIVLHSYSTGKEVDSDGNIEDSFARKTTKSEIFSNDYVSAPNDEPGFSPDYREGESCSKKIKR